MQIKIFCRILAKPATHLRTRTHISFRSAPLKICFITIKIRNREIVSRDRECNGLVTFHLISLLFLMEFPTVAVGKFHNKFSGSQVTWYTDGKWLKNTHPLPLTHNIHSLPETHASPTTRTYHVYVLPRIECMKIVLRLVREGDKGEVQRQFIHLNLISGMSRLHRISLNFMTNRNHITTLWWWLFFRTKGEEEDEKTSQNRW